MSRQVLGSFSKIYRKSIIDFSKLTHFLLLSTFLFDKRRPQAENDLSAHANFFLESMQVTLRLLISQVTSQSDATRILILKSTSIIHVTL